MMKNNLILCGLPGSGKTETSKHLASQLQWQYVDTDACVEKLYENSSGQFLSCREISKKFGENRFRQLEDQIVLTLLDLQKSVISLGGGTLNNPENVKLLKNVGDFVYLKNDRKIIFERLMQKGMPSYLDAQNPYQSFEEIALKRELIYESVADLEIYTEKFSPNEIAAKIIELKKMQI
jgi:shikimate kinase